MIISRTYSEEKFKFALTDTEVSTLVVSYHLRALRFSASIERKLLYIEVVLDSNFQASASEMFLSYLKI